MMSFLNGHRRRATVLSTVILMAGATLVSVSAPAQALTRTSISYRASASRAYTGAVVKVTGRVSPASTPRTVYLQRYYARAWHPVARTRTLRGAYKVTLPTRAAGSFVYRLAVTAGARGARASTRPIRLAVVKKPYGGNPRSYSFISRQNDPTAPIARWNPCGGAIGYRVNFANSTAGAYTDVKATMARVSGATGLRFVYRGGTAILPGRGNDAYPAGTDLVIAWAKPGQSSYLPAEYGSTVAGVGGGLQRSAVDTRGRDAIALVKGLVVLNANMKFSGGFGSGPEYGYQGTRGQLLMHEVAHSVGLGHVNDRYQIMADTMSRKVARWGAGDLNGLRLVGRSAGCLRSA